MSKVKLCDICDFQGGSQPPKSQWITLQQDGYIRMLQIRDFTQPGKVKAEYVKLTNTTKCCLKDDILIARYGASLGKILTGLSGAYNVAMTKAVPNEAVISKKFLYYFLCSDTFQNCILNVGVRAAQAGFNKEDLSNIELYCPDLSIQNKICKILELVDVLINKSNLQLDELDLLVKSRFVDMFGEFIKPENMISLSEMIKDNIIIYHLDGNHGGLYPRTEEFVSEGIPYIGANAIIDGKVDFSKAKYLTLERANGLRKGIAKNGDVLFAHNATVGPVALLRTEKQKVILSTSLTCYRCNFDEILPEYLEYFMRSQYFRSQYERDMQQTTRNQVPITVQKTYLFYIPPIHLQKSFADFVQQVDKSKFVVTAKFQ